MPSANDAYPADLSTGYKRAVAIARALAAQPQCILYDEPTTMVDPIMSDHLGNLMLRLKRQLQLTSVVVTHDLDLMYKVADRVVFLYEGGVIYSGPVAELAQVPTTPISASSWKWTGWREEAGFSFQPLVLLVLDETPQAQDER